MNKESIIEYLQNIKPKYLEEGFQIDAMFGSIADERFNEESDIDILYSITQKFTDRYRGFQAFARLEEIAAVTKRQVDFVPRAYWGQTGKKIHFKPMHRS